MKIRKFFSQIMALALVFLVAVSAVPVSHAVEVDEAQEDGIMLLAEPSVVEINFAHTAYSWTNQLKMKYPCADDTPGYDLSTSGYGFENLDAGTVRDVIYYGKTRKLETEVYCIEPGAHMDDGDQISVGTAYAKAWKGYTSAQKNAVNLALYFGRPGNHDNLSGSDDAQWIATQLIVWEFVTGTRSPTAPYADCDNGTTSGSGYSGAAKTIYNAFFGEKGDHNTEVLKVYNEILTALRNHGKTPSFMAGSPTQELSMSGNSYSYTFTDSNNVLGNYNFSCDNSNVTCAVSGNKLTVTSSVPLPTAATITATEKISGAGLSANLTVAGTAGYQNVIWGADLPTASKATLKVTAKGGSGKISLSKTNSGGESVSGVEYTLFGWAKANSGYTTKYAASVQTTDSNGSIPVGKFPTLSWTDNNDGKFIVVETSVSGAKGVLKDGNAAAIDLKSGKITYYAGADVTVSSSGAAIKNGAKAVKTVDMSKDSAGSYQVSLSFSDSPWTGKITLRKLNEKTNEDLSGAEFTLYRWDGKTYTELEKLTEGKDEGGRVCYSSSQLTYTQKSAGKYRIIETKAPLGVHYDKSNPWTQDVVWTAADQELSYDATNKPFHPSMAVAKLANKTTGATLDNASGRYQGKKKSAIYDAFERVTFKLTVTNTGDRNLFNLRLDDDTSDFAAYIHNKSFAYDVQKGAKLTTNKGKTVTVTSLSQKGNTYSIGFDKLEVGDSFNVTASCVLFSDDGDHNNLENVVHLTSDYDNSDDGEDGNDLTPTPDTIEDEDNHSWDEDEINLRAHGSILIQKKAADDSSLAGVTFALLDKDGKVVSEQTTDAKGVAKWDNLPLSSYSVVETKTLKGMSLLAAPIEVTLPVVMSEDEAAKLGSPTDGILSTDATLYYFDQTFTVRNSPTFQIPHTGGMGFIPWLSLCGTAVFSGCLVLIRRKNKQ